jgi:hypothetical protein
MDGSRIDLPMDFQPRLEKSIPEFKMLKQKRKL